MTSGAATTSSPEQGERGRLVRGALVGLVCGLGAVVAHTTAGTGQVDAWTSSLLVLAGLGLGPALVRRPNLPLLVAGTVGLQLVGHLSMALTGMPGSSGHQMSGTSGMSVAHAATTSPASTALTMILDGGLPMLLGHAVIAVATAALARGADRALLSLLDGWLHAVLVPRPRLNPVPNRPQARVGADLRRPCSCARPSAAGPRAPPGIGLTPAIPA